MNNLFAGIDESFAVKEKRSGVIFGDGGSRGNPGNAGCGFVIYEDKKEVARGGENCGHQTNNYAEYMSLVLALKKSLELGFTDLLVNMDSKLAVEQVSGRWKVKNANIKPLFEKAKALVEQFGSVKMNHVPREQNKVADGIANEFMDMG